MKYFRIILNLDGSSTLVERDDNRFEFQFLIASMYYLTTITAFSHNHYKLPFIQYRYKNLYQSQ